MSYHTLIKSITDEELLSRLSDLVTQSRKFNVELVVHIGEVDDRKLFAGQGFPSMHAYCRERFNLSEGETYRRIAVGRASRKHPILLEMLANGHLHLTGICKLLPHLNDENRESLLKRATRLSLRKIEELIAEVNPKPDVPTKVRKLPEPRTKAPPVPAPQLVPERAKTEVALRTEPPTMAT